MSIPCSFARAEEARQAGWSSRRHHNSGSRDVNVMKFEAKKKAERLVAEQTADENAKRTPAQRIARLDDMFGSGLGAKRERARLASK